MCRVQTRPRKKHFDDEFVIKLKQICDQLKFTEKNKISLWQERERKQLAGMQHSGMKL